MCGELYWRVVFNKGRKIVKLDEIGFEIVGCRYGLVQWVVNMYQGELYGYVYYIQVKKMILVGVVFFWEDVVCKYWKWVKKVGGVEGFRMRLVFFVMYVKVYNWICQVLGNFGC